MKELTIEQKARAYDEALKVLHKYDGANIMFSQSLKEEMFPELRESEDEKTKKEIINYLECQSRDEPSRKDTHNKWISYIEKYALSKDDYSFLRDCARVLKTFGWQSYADRLTALCPALGEEAKAMMSTPIIFDESEDERIRKELIEQVVYIVPNSDEVDSEGNVLPTYEKRIDKYIAWLEKQGEIDKESYEIDEKEKREFVGDGFIKCYADFQDFKEGETYWLEYVGNDNYNVRSDNLLGKTYHITPCQLYTIFKKQTWLEKQGEQKPWSEEDKNFIYDTLSNLTELKDRYGAGYGNVGKCISWLKSLRPQNTWKPSNEQMQILHWSIPLWIESKPKAILESLINDLKKLKGEE